MELRDKNGMTESEFLTAYKPGNYERPSLTADIAVFQKLNGKIRILLIKRGGHPFLGKWALPGGFAEKNETIESTARRELEEETAIKGLKLIPVGLFTTPGRDPRTWVVSQAFASVIPASQNIAVTAQDDAASASWFDVSAQFREGQIQLIFQSEKDSFDALLLKDENPDFTEENIKIRKSEKLAFDHAVIIACAMKKAELF